MKKTFLILLLIILLALAFRIPALLSDSSFWFDEAVSLDIARHNLLDSWQYLKWENNPPLHYWFLHFWIKIFSVSEITVRLSSILISLLNILAIYFFGRKLVNKKVGLFAAFLMSISSFYLYISTDARMYPLLVLFGILSSYYCLVTLENPRLKYWFLFFLFSTLTLYTHLTGFFFIFSFNFYFFYYYFYLKKRTPKLISWLLVQLAILTAFSPWLINFIFRSFSTISADAWYLNTPSGGFLLFQLPKSFLLIGQNYQFLEFFALILFAFLFLYSFAKILLSPNSKNEFLIKLNFSPQFIFAFFIFATPVLIGFLLQIWVAKYYLPASIGLFLILAMGYNNLKIKNKQIIIPAIIFLLIPYNLGILKINRHSWHKVARYIERIEQPDDKIIIAAFVYKLPFEYYYRGNLEVVDYKPKGLEDDLLLRTVKYNWYPVLTKQNMPDLNQIMANQKRAIVVNPYAAAAIHNSNIVIDWFVENNWRLVHKEQFGGFIRPTVFIFQNPNLNSDISP